jgi:hypothetical protein
VSKIRVAIASVAALCGLMLAGAPAEAASSGSVASVPATVEGTWHYVGAYYYEWLCDVAGSNYINNTWPAYTTWDCVRRPDTWYDLYVFRDQ